MVLYYQLVSFLQLFPPLKAIFDFFGGYFWPPLRPRDSQTCLYEAWPLVPFSYYGISQKRTITINYFDFYSFFTLLRWFLTFFGGCFRPPLRARNAQPCLYETWPLVPFIECEISQKMDLTYQFCSFFAPFFLFERDLFTIFGLFLGPPEVLKIPNTPRVSLLPNSIHQWRH